MLEASAAFLGFGLHTPLAKAEFFSVYGGLQFGLGLAMLVMALRDETRRAGLLFGLIFSSSLLVFRLISYLRFGGSEVLFMMILLEGVIVALFIVACCRQSIAKAGSWLGG